MLKEAREPRHLCVATWAEVRIDLTVKVLEIAVKEVVFVLAEDELVGPVTLRCQCIESISINVAAAARFEMDDLITSVMGQSYWGGKMLPCRRTS